MSLVNASETPLSSPNPSRPYICQVVLYAFYKNITYVSCFTYFTFFSGAQTDDPAPQPPPSARRATKQRARLYLIRTLNAHATHDPTHNNNPPTRPLDMSTRQPGFSAQSLFFSVYIATFNAVWAALPTIAYGIVDQVGPPLYDYFTRGWFVVMLLLYGGDGQATLPPHPVLKYTLRPTTGRVVRSSHGHSPALLGNEKTDQQVRASRI
jgi:hypothetical protein